jgi:uncharacterized protein with FMN-binding domain
MNPIKKMIEYFLCALVIFQFVLLFGCTPKDAKIQPAAGLEKFDLTHIADGKFRGSHVQDDNEYNVEVTVARHKITNIEILEGDDRILTKKCAQCSAEVLIAEIIQQQKLEVDAISGATRTTHSILQAIKNALSLP